MLKKIKIANKSKRSLRCVLGAAHGGWASHMNRSGSPVAAMTGWFFSWSSHLISFTCLCLQADSWSTVWQLSLTLPCPQKASILVVSVNRGSQVALKGEGSALCPMWGTETGNSWGSRHQGPRFIICTARVSFVINCPWKTCFSIRVQTLGCYMGELLDFHAEY